MGCKIQLGTRSQELFIYKQYIQQHIPSCLLYSSVFIKLCFSIDIFVKPVKSRIKFLKALD